MRPRLFIVALLSLALTGCDLTPAQLAKQQTAEITQTLGGLGTVQVTKVVPPIGPWHLYSRGSYYWRAHVDQTGEDYYVEVYQSLWSLASQTTVYGYRYYHDTTVPLLGHVYSRVNR